MLDVDRDGDNDLVMTENEIKAGRIAWLESLDGKGQNFAERVVLDANLGGHAAVAADFDGDGDLDVASKLWRPRKDNANEGRNHVDFLENVLKAPRPRKE